jgi:hypothetical protein
MIELTYKRDHSCKHFKTEIPNQYICRQSLGLAHYFDGKNFEEIVDIPFPEGKEIKSEADLGMIDIPAWAEIELSADKKEAWFKDKKGVRIHRFGDAFVCDKNVEPHSVVDKDGKKTELKSKDLVNKVKNFDFTKGEKIVVDETKIIKVNFCVKDNKLAFELPTGVEAKDLKAFDDTATVSTTKGTYADSSDGTTDNHKADLLVLAQIEGARKWRGFIGFTMSSGSGDISKVELFMKTTASVSSSQLDLHATDKSFVDSEANWVRYKSGSNWSSAGGDLGSVADHNTGSSANTFYGFVLMGTGSDNPMSLDWGGEANLILKFNSESGDKGCHFYSNGNATPGNRPYVDITYTAGPEPITLTEVVKVSSSKLNSIGRIFASSLAVASSLTNAGTFKKTLSEAIAAISLIVKMPGKLLTSTIGLNSAMIKNTGREFSETLVVDEIILRVWTLARTFLETIIVAPIHATVLTAVRVFSETIKAGDKLLQSIGRIFNEVVAVVDPDANFKMILVEVYSEVVAVAGSLGQWVIGKLFIQPIAFVCNLAIQATATFIESIKVAEQLIKQAGLILAELVAVGWEKMSNVSKNFFETIKINQAVIEFLRTKRFTEIIAVADSFLASASKVLSEIVAVAYSAVFQKSFFKTLTEVVKISSSLVKRAGLMFIEIITAATNWLFEKTQYIELSDSVSVGDGFIKKGMKIFIEIVRVPVLLSFAAARTFSEIIAVAANAVVARAYYFIEAIKIGGAIGSWAIGKIFKETIKIVLIFTEGRTAIFSEVLAVSGRILNQTARIFSEVVAIAGALAGFAIGKIIVQTVKLGDITRFKKTQYKILADSVKVAGVAVKMAGRALVEVVVAVSALGNWAIGKLFIQSVKVNDEYSKAWTLSRIFSETVSVIDNVFSQASKIFSETITATDEFVRGLVSKLFVEIVRIGEVLNKQWTLSRVYSEIISVAENFFNQAGKIFSETVAIVGEFVLGTISKVFIEIVNVGSAITKSIPKTFEEIIAVSGNLFNQNIKVFTETLAVAGSFVLGTISKVFIETVVIGEALTRTISRVFSEIISAIDSAIKAVSGRIFSENPTVAGAMQNFTIGKLLKETITVGWAKIKLVLNGIQVGLWKKVARVATGVWRKISRNDN